MSFFGRNKSAVRFGFSEIIREPESDLRSYNYWLFLKLSPNATSLRCSTDSKCNELLYSFDEEQKWDSQQVFRAGIRRRPFSIFANIQPVEILTVKNARTSLDTRAEHRSAVAEDLSLSNLVILCLPLVLAFTPVSLFDKVSDVFVLW